MTPLTCPAWPSCWSWRSFFRPTKARSK